MCRSIKPLRTPEGAASDEEVEAAALQFVRKVSNYRKPARKNEAAFDAAVAEVAAATRRLLDQITSPATANSPSPAKSGEGVGG